VFKLDRYCMSHNCRMELELLSTFKRPTVNYPFYIIYDGRFNSFAKSDINSAVRP